jgi:hypothetical protein
VPEDLGKNDKKRPQGTWSGSFNNHVGALMEYTNMLIKVLRPKHLCSGMEGSD